MKSNSAQLHAPVSWSTLFSIQVKPMQSLVHIQVQAQPIYKSAGVHQQNLGWTVTMPRPRPIKLEASIWTRRETEAKLGYNGGSF